MGDAPERVGVKMTDGYERNCWGVLTHIYDDDAVQYVRADIAAAELAEARNNALEEADGVIAKALGEGSCIPAKAVPFITGIRNAIRKLKEKAE